MSLWLFGCDIKIEKFYICMRGNSNVVALVFIGEPTCMACVILVCSADECVYDCCNGCLKV